MAETSFTPRPINSGANIFNHFNLHGRLLDVYPDYPELCVTKSQIHQDLEGGSFKKLPWHKVTVFLKKLCHLLSLTVIVTTENNKSTFY